MDSHLHRARDDCDAKQLVEPTGPEEALARQMTHQWGSLAPLTKRLGMVTMIYMENERDDWRRWKGGKTCKLLRQSGLRTQTSQTEVFRGKWVHAKYKNGACQHLSSIQDRAVLRAIHVHGVGPTQQDGHPLRCQGQVDDHQQQQGGVERHCSNQRSEQTVSSFSQGPSNPDAKQCHQ